MTAGFNFNNYAAGFCSATPALRGNEVSMDTIDLGNSESLVCGVFPNQDGTFTAMTYTKSKTFKTENGARRWLERNSGHNHGKGLRRILRRPCRRRRSSQLQ